MMFLEVLLEYATHYNGSGLGRQPKTLQSPGWICSSLLNRINPGESPPTWANLTKLGGQGWFANCPYDTAFNGLILLLTVEEENKFTVLQPLGWHGFMFSLFHVFGKQCPQTPHGYRVIAQSAAK